MTIQKITLSPSRDIPFNKLVLSQSNVRRVKAGVSIEELADDIARRTLIHGLSVRAVVDADGIETGMFEIPAGGRRYRALELLVKQKRLAKTAPVPCVVRTSGVAEEDSLAENVQRAPLHPLDQFRAFLALREKGESEEEIAAAFFVSVGVVKQRLRLAAVSPKLLDAYAEDAMTLEQLMAFTVSGDHERQEQVFERLCSTYDKQPYAIRRMLTEGAVRASDKRAQLIGVAAYEEAGGAVMNDLFQGDDGGWLQDVALVDLMVAERLHEETEAIRAEGWKWIEFAPDLPYDHVYGMRQLFGEQEPLTIEEEASLSALTQEAEDIETAAADELTDEQDSRMAEIEAAMEEITGKPLIYDPLDIARADAFVSIAYDGSLPIERGFIRREDELVEPEPAADVAIAGSEGFVPPDISVALEPIAEPEEDEGLKPLSDRLVSELTAHRTVALRQALGEQPDIAFVAALHVLCLQVFYAYALDACVELTIKSVGFSTQATGLADNAAAIAVGERHQALRVMLPKEASELWDALLGFGRDTNARLFAHCVAQGVNACVEPYNRRPRAIAHAERLAQAVDLDMTAAGWRPTVDNYLGRVTKARILLAVEEGSGARAAERLAHLKKDEMAERTEMLLDGSGWLPEPLRTPGRALPRPEEVMGAAYDVDSTEPVAEASGLTLDGADEPAWTEQDEEVEPIDPDFEPAHAIAAE